MKRTVFLLLFAVIAAACGPLKNTPTQGKSPIQANIDLVNVLEDKVKVTIDPGIFVEDVVYFSIPKIIPGTYSEDNYGKYLEDFNALDYDGKSIAVTKQDDNSWIISSGTKLDKIVYYVNDTYDTETEISEPVFSPAGTNILKDENYLLNLHGFIGYFKGQKEVPYELKIQAPTNLKPSTSLRQLVSGASDPNTYVFYAERYFEIIDNPILFSKPNSTSFQINNIKVTLSVYSPGGVYKAEDFREKMETMMQAQKTFLGEIDGTQQYTILLYLSTLAETDATGFGALEHHTSTVVVMPEQLPKELMEESLVDVISHEFFHILTPLNVHSREIQYFDFNQPIMSQHLWMYEGATEYFSNLFQVQQGLIDESNFYSRILEKISNAKGYDDRMPFTTMSTNVLRSPYKENYNNVYEKGALINMSLDITLRDLSGGEKGILWLMKELSKKYDKDTPFEDSELINTIVRMTYPEIRTFFDDHVLGNVPISYESILQKVGLSIVTEQEQGQYFFYGQIPYVDADPADLDTIFIMKGMNLNSFFTSLGAQGGDVISNINGTNITLDSMRRIIGESFGWSPEKEIQMTVLREGKELVLKGKAGIPTNEERSIVESENANPENLELRRAWLKS